VVLAVTLAASGSFIFAHKKPGQAPPASNEYAGDAACRNCHVKEFEGYEQTRHHRTSQLPSSTSILGKFNDGKNTMETFNPQVRFRMDARGDAFFETAITGKPSQKKNRTERIDLVIGSGRKGQTYLYWRGDQLFELPVSYWTASDRWTNSPGYVDGSADFERPVTPRCLECHATSFTSLPAATGYHFDKSNFVLRISCERCHGPAGEHIRMHAANTANSNAEATTSATSVSPHSSAPLPPTGIDRARQIDVCAQCHGGVGESVTPPFSFRPGEPLSNSLTLEPFNPRARVDVHGNQVALLEKSRCFQSSPSMTCSTCHNLHAPERDAASYSDRCLTCHKPESCPTFTKTPHRQSTNCIDCHMPNQTSKSLVLDIEDEQVGARVRSHWIRVYPESTPPNSSKLPAH
jgi:hypothetical protein